jgi:hypothetical protein
MEVSELLEVVKLMSGKKAKPETESGGDIKIAVLQMGWVAVGKYYRKGTECRLENAYIIRRWGTSEGLGELAAKGPLGETKLEPCPLPIRFHRSGEVFNLDCVVEKWASKFQK